MGRKTNRGSRKTMMTPQLQKLINDCNNRNRKDINLQYKDGHTARLKSDMTGVVVTTTNPQLLITVTKILEKILRGDVKRVIDKNE